MRRIIAGLEEGIIVILMAVMTLFVFAEVVLRYGFGTGIIWAEEFTQHMSAWMVLFGASWCLKNGSHIAVETLIRNIGPAARRVLGVAAVAGGLVYCALLGYGAWVYLEKVRSIGIELEDLPVQRWLAHSILLIGLVLLAVRLLEAGWAIWRGERDSLHISKPIKELVSENSQKEEAA